MVGFRTRLPKLQRETRRRSRRRLAVVSCWSCTELMRLCGPQRRAWKPTWPRRGQTWLPHRCEGGVRGGVRGEALMPQHADLAAARADVAAVFSLPAANQKL